MTAYALDSWTLTRRTLLQWRNQPAGLALGLFFPVMILLMFAYLFGGAMQVPGGGDYKEFLLPGIFVLTMAFGLESTFQAVSTDAGRGVTDRFRTMPISSAAVLTGRSVADMLYAAVGLIVLIACGLAVGWRWHDGPVNALLAVGLLLLLRYALLWFGIWLALAAGKPEMLMAVQILVWPLAFLSSVFTAPETMPGWLGAIAEWNPLSATASATRELFGNPGQDGHFWLAVGWPVLLLAVFMPLAVRRYRRLT
ncbi:ABC transporter DrrB family efflux protein [Actinoplanes tereljensis]|uniref:Transport permease protein n=1 Tax=Paractinoplanes tereljensis TaxID=571912 RepID=A0A919NHY7_9ACTN|nr:ABC transporter permease [Actinoplanes tereljensis]GIF19006.1 transport permease protein [Actinoplanes tereljensis]